MPEAALVPSDFRMPAEWAPHRATWFSWPHNTETWPDELPQVEAALAGAVKALARHEPVYVGVLDETHRKHVAARLDEAGVRGEIYFHAIRTNDAWARDHGAIFVKHRGTGDLAATVWGFNSWGGKYPHEHDALVPRKMAGIFGVPVLDGGIILEGGSIDVNGAGALLTTRSCLLNENRNPHLSQTEIEDRLKRFLGIEKVLWLGEGIVGDDTDGHVDDITRFVGEDAVVTVVETDPQNENYDALRENLEALYGMTLHDGRPLRVETLPMPAPVVLKGEPMPASYANFYIGNRTVLLPVFDDPHDETAIQTLTRFFPDREIVPVPCRDVIWGQGALHCLTQQVPL